MHNIDQDFQAKVWDFYKRNFRTMPWRDLDGRDEQDIFYRVLVSEVMLQQTSVQRVRDKFALWMDAFPQLEDVARASTSDILRLWQGLGYNRRARYLYDVCVHYAHNSTARSPEELSQHKGIGYNTSAAIFVYTYNKPVAFIETNIRTVYIHEYFSHTTDIVADKELMPIISRTLDYEKPREWFWALMDYGAYLKKTVRNNHRSASYTKQSEFKGSKRQLSSHILRLILEKNHSLDDLQNLCGDDRTKECIDGLVKSGLVECRGKLYCIRGG